MKKTIYRLSARLSVGLLLMNIHSCSAQVHGCTDPLAGNYDPSATVNDGSCTYDPFSLSPVDTHPLDGSVSETSGLTLWEDLVWTHNDNTDTKLYGLNRSDGAVNQDIELRGVENRDWEEISQDDQYLYIGDIGNNLGNRRDLRILRVEKNPLAAGEQVIDTIWYSYEDQADFDPGGGQNTDFDCEAFVVAEENIYLFTKQWISLGTDVYAIPKIPGTYQAENLGSCNVKGLVTGAAYLEHEHLLVLSGYTSYLYPFFHLCYDFRDHDFFSGNSRRIAIALPFHQVEGIATENGLDYYASNERSSVLVNVVPQRLHLFDMRELLEDYLLKVGGGTDYPESRVKIWPSPAGEFISVEVRSGLFPVRYEILDDSARVVMKGRLRVESTRLDIGNLVPGGYTFRFLEGNLDPVRFIKH